MGTGVEGDGGAERREGKTVEEKTLRGPGGFGEEDDDRICVMRGLQKKGQGSLYRRQFFFLEKIIDDSYGQLERRGFDIEREHWLS